MHANLPRVRTSAVNIRGTFLHVLSDTAPLSLLASRTRVLLNVLPVIGLKLLLVLLRCRNNWRAFNARSNLVVGSQRTMIKGHFRRVLRWESTFILSPLMTRT